MIESIRRPNGVTIASSQVIDAAAGFHIVRHAWPGDHRLLARGTLLGEENAAMPSTGATAIANANIAFAK